MCIEVHRELGRPKVFLKDQVEKLSSEARPTMTLWESDRFILGGAHAAEGNDSHVEDCGGKHIPDNVELDQI
jgi:hypothetical protein